MTTDQPPAFAAPTGDIVARAGQYYRNTRYIMCALLVGAGLWFAYDGWVGWPAHNVKVREVKLRVEQAEKSGDQAAAAAARTELGKLSKEKTNSDIMLQKILAMSLPPVGIALLAWALFNSRGAYRLSGRTLHVPGHPPVPVDQITQIDRKLWDRKGIAYLSYQGGTKPIKLDDFVYDRKPTDQIFERIESELSPEAESGATEAM